MLSLLHITQPYWVHQCHTNPKDAFKVMQVNIHFLMNMAVNN